MAEGFWCISSSAVLLTAFAGSRTVTHPIGRDAIYRRRRFPRDVIETCVRWYLTYRLSYRDLVSLMAERRGARDAHHHHAVGLSIRTRIREAVEPPGEAGRFVLARRRDLHSHPA